MCKKEVILCVDDEENQLAVRKLVLESKGYDVLTAASGRQALGLLAQHQVDLVLSDHLMPGLTGAELARQIKAQKPELPGDFDFRGKRDTGRCRLCGSLHEQAGWSHGHV